MLSKSRTQPCLWYISRTRFHSEWPRKGSKYLYFSKNENSYLEFCRTPRCVAVNHETVLPVQDLMWFVRFHRETLLNISRWEIPYLSFSWIWKILHGYGVLRRHALELPVVENDWILPLRAYTVQLYEKIALHFHWYESKATKNHVDYTCAPCSEHEESFWTSSKYL